MKSTKFSTAASTIKPTRTALQRFNITSDVPHPFIRYVMNKPKNETKHQILLGTLRNTKHQIWVSPSVDCRPSASTKTLLSDEDDEKIHIGTVVRLSNEGQIEMDAFWAGFTVHNWQQEYSRYFEIIGDVKPISAGTVKVVTLIHGRQTVDVAKHTTTHEIREFERRSGHVPIMPVSEKELKSGKPTQAKPVAEDGGLSEWPKSKFIGSSAEKNATLTNTSQKPANTPKTTSKKRQNDGAESNEPKRKNITCTSNGCQPQSEKAPLKTTFACRHQFAHPVAE